ncbi:MAG: type II toxin-antitoxin system VapC family toxin [Desulfobacteraceae bacterium]|nr:type II toxin-antitoxin system VapC family toxin [Desulfobacteraceae bacterium]
MFLLDTNIVSYWMRGDQKIIKKLKKHKPYELSLSTITLAEIFYGIRKSNVKKKERLDKIESICAQLDIFPFDKTTADNYGTIRVFLERKGIPISERDLQIASIAMANNLIVVTHNIKEFERISGLISEDWAA